MLYYFIAKYISKLYKKNTKKNDKNYYDLYVRKFYKINEFPRIYHVHNLWINVHFPRDH